MKILPSEFDGQPIRRMFDEELDVWWFSVIDVVQVLTQQADYQTARKYWNQLKLRLGKEGSESVTNCHRLKLPAADGKNYLTDVATAETLLRLVQSIPSPKAEPIKLWPARKHQSRQSRRRHCQAGAQTTARPNRQAGGLKAELPAAWGCESFVEVFTKEG